MVRVMGTFARCSQAFAAMAIGLIMAVPASACHVALLLAIDVSNSIDEREYEIQSHGLAQALRDPEIADALVEGQIAVSVVQWSGTGNQSVSIPWRQILKPEDVAQISEEARAMPRAFNMSNTAIGEAVDFGLAYFSEAPACARKVIDVSGDGADNAGTRPADARRRAERSGVQINGLAIDSIGLAVTTYFRRVVITRDGFVMTAHGHSDYARKLRAKIRREISQVLF